MTVDEWERLVILAKAEAFDAIMERDKANEKMDAAIANLHTIIGRKP